MKDFVSGRIGIALPVSLMTFWAVFIGPDLRWTTLAGIAVLAAATLAAERALRNSGPVVAAAGAEAVPAPRVATSLGACRAVVLPARLDRDDEPGSRWRDDGGR